MLANYSFLYYNIPKGTEKKKGFKYERIGIAVYLFDKFGYLCFFFNFFKKLNSIVLCYITSTWLENSLNITFKYRRGMNHSTYSCNRYERDLRSIFMAQNNNTHQN